MQICNNNHARVVHLQGPCPVCFERERNQKAKDKTIELQQELATKRVEMVQFSGDCHVIADDILGYDTDIKLKDKIKLIGDELAKLKAEKPATQPKYKPGDTVVIDKEKVHRAIDSLPKDGVLTLGDYYCGDENQFEARIDGNNYVVVAGMIKCLAPEQEDKERVPWTAQDYAKRQIVWLRDKASGNICIITDIYHQVLTVAGYGISKPFVEITEKFTLPDGTELYKEKHE